jgi:hypothetical protein
VWGHCQYEEQYSGSDAEQQRMVGPTKMVRNTPAMTTMTATVNPAIKSNLSGRRFTPSSLPLAQVKARRQSLIQFAKGCSAKRNMTAGAIIVIGVAASEANYEQEIIRAMRAKKTRQGHHSPPASNASLQPQLIQNCTIAIRPSESLPASFSPTE